MAAPTADYSDKTDLIVPPKTGTKYGDLLGNFLGNQDPKVGDMSAGSIDTQTADDPPQTITTNIPASPDRTNLVKSFENMGLKMFEFFAAMDTGTDTAVTFAIQGGPKLVLSKTPPGFTLEAGGNKIEATAAGIKITGATINLN